MQGRQSGSVAVVAIDLIHTDFARLMHYCAKYGWLQYTTVHCFCWHRSQGITGVVVGRHSARFVLSTPKEPLHCVYVVGRELPA